MLSSHIDPSSTKAKTICTIFGKPVKDSTTWEHPVAWLLYKHCNKTQSPISLFDKADAILLAHYYAAIDFPQMKRGFDAWVDGHAHDFAAILERRKHEIQSEKNIDLRWLKINLQEKPRVFDGLDNRATLVQNMVLNGLQVCPKLFEELKGEWSRLSYVDKSPSQIEGNDCTQTLEYFGIKWYNYFDQFRKIRGGS